MEGVNSIHDLGAVFIKVVQPRKIRPQEKIHNFAFKNSNIVIEGIIQKRKDYFL